ncbi:MAG: phosphoethanolamine--lipid A transferase [Steroidobacteraceae bacterium]
MGIRRLLALPRLSDAGFAVLAAVLWLLFYNQRFWVQTVAAMGSGAAPWLFYAALALLLLFLHALLLLLMPGRNAMRVCASLMFIIAALCAYFTDAFGTAFDREMIRNVVETDHAEAADLLSIGLFARLLLMGVVPAVLLWFVPLEPQPWRRALQQRMTFLGAGALASIVMVLCTSASFAVFLREHKPLRSLLSPGAAIVSSIGYLRSASLEAVPRVDPGGQPWRVAPAGPTANQASTSSRSAPLLVVVVVGETTRAANFGLNGYPWPTTPELAARDDLVYYPDTQSCGTATAVSVPCMFSHLGREHFSHTENQRYLNLLDMLQAAGVHVQWIDNNSGCKGVCERVASVTPCPPEQCRDEVLAQQLAQQLPDIRQDSLIVLHQNGSHGPAYFQRYPQSAEYFRPACHSSRLDLCSSEEVVNAYDNTVRYTDSQLAALIAQLQAASGLDTALLYVSDHGESLGESGVYLHGMPYRFAPLVQKQVPMLLWMSSGYLARSHMDLGCLRQRTVPASASQDNLFHTVMGLLGVRNGVYAEGLDLTRGCSAGYAPLIAGAGQSPGPAHSQRRQQRQAM